MDTCAELCMLEFIARCSSIHPGQARTERKRKRKKPIPMNGISLDVSIKSTQSWLVGMSDEAILP